MKAIVCELCESNELLKEGEFFVCQHCGTKYGAEEAKKLLVDDGEAVEQGIPNDTSSTTAETDTEKKKQVLIAVCIGVALVLVVGLFVAFGALQKGRVHGPGVEVSMGEVTMTLSPNYKLVEKTSAESSSLFSTNSTTTSSAKYVHFYLDVLNKDAESMPVTVSAKDPSGDTTYIADDLTFSIYNRCKDDSGFCFVEPYGVAESTEWWIRYTGPGTYIVYVCPIIVHSEEASAKFQIKITE